MASAQKGTAISHVRTLIDWEQDAIPTLLKLEKVMPGLVQRKVVPKKKGNKIVEKNDLSFFLGILKAKPIEAFVNFLQALADTFPECESHRELVLKMRDSLERIYLPADSEAYRAAIQEVITRAALEDQPTQQAVHEIQSSGSGEVTSKDEDMRTSSSAEETSSSVPQPASSDPTIGYIEPCRSWQFTREGMVQKEGLFHCPAHGIIGHIPATAVPPGIDSFEIRMKVFMQGDFRFPADVEPCTAVVELTLHPNFVFIEDITVKIPHCVDGEIDPEAFCLLIASDEHASVFEFTDLEVETVDSNSYHVVGKLGHFSRTVGARKRRQSRSRTRSTGSISKKKATPNLKFRKCQQMSANFKRQSSQCSSLSSEAAGNSFESSYEEDQAASPLLSHTVMETTTDCPTPSQHLPRQEALDTGSDVALVSSQSSSDDGGCCELCIAQCMLHQCIGGWETNFLLSCAHPTGLLVLTQAVEKICTGTRSNITAVKMCRPTESHLEFIAQENRDGWDICVTTGTPVIEVQVVTQFHNFPDKLSESLVNTGLYPPQVGYLVRCADASRQLRCKINVEGAEINGKPLYFMLTSTQITSTVTRRLHTCQDLYQSESNICSEALSDSAAGADLPLDSQCEDHRRFIADISFQLTEIDFQQLTGLLEISQPELDRVVGNCGTDLPERIYQVVLSWMSRHYPNSSIKTLLAVLQKLGIGGIDLSSWSDESICSIIYCHISKNAIHSKDFVLAIALEIKQRWKFVGRFVGVSESDISAMIQEGFLENNVWEMSVQMLQKWQQQKAEKATYGTLYKAIYRVFEHDPSSICSAWWFCRKHIICSSA